MTKNKYDSTFDPSAIWDLDEADRPAVVIDCVRELGVRYREAVESADSRLAQECAICAIWAFSGLFPDANDPGHQLLLAFYGMLIDATGGKKDHILLQNTGIVPGIKGGFGHATVIAFAISAVELLSKLTTISKRQIYIHVEKILSEAGYASSRKGPHEEKKSVTASGILSWCNNIDSYPAQHVIAKTMLENHFKNLSCHNIKNIEVILYYLTKQAAIIVGSSPNI